MHRAENIAVIGHGHSRHAKLFGAMTELFDVAGAVEHGVVGMKMQVDELRHFRSGSRRQALGLGSQLLI